MRRPPREAGPASRYPPMAGQSDLQRDAARIAIDRSNERLSGGVDAQQHRVQAQYLGQQIGIAAFG